MPPDRREARRLGTAPALAVLAALSCAAPVGAATPSVSGTVAGKLPARSQTATEIRAFDLAGASLVAATSVSASGAFSLALPPGAYLLQLGATPRRGRSNAAASTLLAVSVAPGQRRRGLRIARPKASAGAAARPRARAAYTQESGKITPGWIAFSIENFSGATGDFSVLNRGLAAMLMTDLATTSCRTTEVANSSDRALIVQEHRLGRSRYFDPASRVARNFIKSDIVVRGRLQTRGADLAYALTLTDARTGNPLETLGGTLAAADVFGGEQRLAARLARAICGYGEVFEVTFTGTGIGDFATHAVTGTLTATPISAKPVARDAGGATRWEGSAAASWTGVTAAPKIPCGYDTPLSGGNWQAKLERAGEQMRVHWLADKATDGTLTVSCPEAPPIAGQPANSLTGSAPPTFILPADAKQAITGGLQDGGSGWNNTLELKIRTTNVQRLP